jgi:two-component system sensor histidine kinase PilS (NtrC family)
VAAALYVAAVLKFRVATSVDLVVASLLLLTALVVTLVSFWHTHVRDRTPGRLFFYLQALFDTAMITVVVHTTGGPQSDFAGLYVVLVAVTAVLMPATGATLVTIIVALAYLGDVMLGFSGTSILSTAIQVAVFGLVAVVTAYLATRVSRIGAEREALAGELRQARLEAADVLRQLRSGVVTVDAQGHLLSPTRPPTTCSDCRSPGGSGARSLGICVASPRSSRTRSPRPRPRAASAARGGRVHLPDRSFPSA